MSSCSTLRALSSGEDALDGVSDTRSRLLLSGEICKMPQNMHTLRLPWLDSNPVAPELQRQCSSLGMTQAARLGPPPGPDQEHLDV